MIYLYDPTVKVLTNLSSAIQVSLCDGIKHRDQINGGEEVMIWNIEISYADNDVSIIPYVSKHLAEKDFEKILSVLPFNGDGIIIIGEE